MTDQVGADVGFVASGAEGCCVRVRGVFVAVEKSAVELVVVAVSPLAMKAVQKDLVRYSSMENELKKEFSFVKIPREALVLDLEGWPPTVAWAKPSVRAMLKAYYNLEEEVDLPSTDSMFSASSGVARAGGDSQRLRREVAALEEALGGAKKGVTFGGPRPNGPMVGGSSTRPVVERASAWDGPDDGDDEYDGAEDSGENRFFEEARPRMEALWGNPKKDLGARSAGRKAAPSPALLMGLGQGSGDRVRSAPPPPERLDYEDLMQRFGRTGAGEPARNPESEVTRLLNEGGGQQGVGDLVQLMMLQELKKLREQDDGGQGSGGKALKRLHSLHENILENPRGVVKEYVAEVMDNLGVEAGESWQLWQWTQQINWGRMKGLHRLHYHISHALTLGLRGENDQSHAYLAQTLRAIYQVSLDNGSWETASYLLPRRDPVTKVEFGGTHKELETIYAYREALKKLKKSQDPSGEPKGEGKGKAKKEGDGL
jgi:hypothetical protein